MIAALLDHLWQSTAFAALAGALTLLLRNNSAAVRYRLWFAASIKFLIPFSLFSAIGSTFFKPVSIGISAPFAFDFQPVARPFSATVPVMSVPTTSVNLGAVILAVWALGTIMILAIGLVRRVQLHNLVRSARPLAVTDSTPVCSCPSLLEPALVGIWRPVILLPDGIEAHLSSDEMRVMLEHELCHLRRRDNLTAMVHMFVEALFWFHPLLWWLEKRLVEERERACDESVLQGDLDPEIYAESILKVCKFYLHSPLACVAGISGADLKLRVEAIMRSTPALRLNGARKLLLAVCAVLAFAAPVFLGLMIAPPLVAMAQGNALSTRSKASPGTEAILRREITGLQNGAPPFDAMSPALADTAHKQHLMSEALVKSWGALKSLSFRSVSAQGTDVYDVVFEHALTFWSVGQREADGKIHSLFFGPAYPRSDYTKPSPGTEASLRRYISAIQKGQPNYEEMTPGMADIVREGAAEIIHRIQGLGAMKSITFQGVGPPGTDIYDVTFANGKTEWTIAPLTADGKVERRAFGIMP